MKTVLSPLSAQGYLSIGALALAGIRPLRPWSAWLAAAGALAVGLWSPHREDFVPLLVAVAVWRGAISTARLDERLARNGMVPVLFLLSAGGAYACLPDTEQIIPLAVVAFLAAVVAIVVPGILFGGPVSMAAIGIYGWVAAAGGIGRAPATIGALGALGVLLFAGQLRGSRQPVVPLAAHVGCVAVCSRVAGISHDVAFASVVVAATLAATLLAMLVSSRR